MAIDVKATALDADGKLLTRASGIPAGITRAALAADAAFSGVYSPVVTEIVLSPVTATVGSGGAVTSSAGVPILNLPDSSNPFGSFTVAIPAAWTTFDIDVEHFSSGTGAFFCRADLGWLADGDTVTVVNGTAGFPVAATTLGQDTIRAGISPVAGKILSLRILRSSADAGDVLAATASIRAVRLIQAS